MSSSQTLASARSIAVPLLVVIAAAGAVTTKVTVERDFILLLHALLSTSSAFTTAGASFLPTDARLNLNGIGQYLG